MSHKLPVKIWKVKGCMQCPFVVEDVDVDVGNSAYDFNYDNFCIFELTKSKDYGYKDSIDDCESIDRYNYQEQVLHNCPLHYNDFVVKLANKFEHNEAIEEIDDIEFLNTVY